MKRELKIGLFLAGVFLILGLIIFIVGDMSRWFRRGGYELDTSFASAAGLEKQAAVRLAGVKIGYVGDIRLVNRRAEVAMSIFPQYRVPKGSRASLSSFGMIGEKYVEITPGDQADYCAPGDSLEGTATIGFDQLGSMAAAVGEDIRALSRSLNEITGEGSRADIRETLSNLNAFTGDLQEFLAANGRELGTGIQGFARASRDLDRRIGEVAKGLNEAIAAVNSIAAENRAAVKSDIDKVGVVLDDLRESVRILRQTLEKIDKGEGTVGRLVHDPEMYESAKTTLASVDRVVQPLGGARPIGGFRMDYLADSRRAKAAASLGLSLASGAFALGQVVRDPVADRYRYSVQGGMRWSALAARGGLIESTFGAGLDLIALDDRLVFSLEGYDFERGIGPRFRFTTQFSLVRYLHLVAGVDDFGQGANRQFYFGLGVGVR